MLKKLLAGLLLVGSIAASGQSKLGGHPYVPSPTDSLMGQASISYTADADCTVLSATNCTVSPSADGPYLGTYIVSSSASLSGPHALTVPNGPGRYIVVENNTTQTLNVGYSTGSTFPVLAGTKAFVHCDGTNCSAPFGAGSFLAGLTGDVTATAPIGGGSTVATVQGINGGTVPSSAKLLGTDSAGKPTVASSSDVQSVIGTGVYDPSGAAAARSATGSCGSGLFEIADGTAGPTCQSISYTNIVGTPSSLPPSGSASGDLSGSYPGPTVSKVNGAAVPTSAKLIGTNSSGQPVQATTSDVQSVIGTGVYDPSGAAAARSATDTCTPGQYENGDSTTGPSCAAVAYSQVTGTPTSLPPNGAAGGDLSGSYPSPTVAKVNGASVPASAKVLGSNASGQPVSASSSDVQSAIGTGVYDPSGAAAARSATGTCASGKYETADGTSGPTCSYITEVHATTGSIDGVTLGITTPAAAHVSSLTVDSLAGASNNVLATTNTSGTVGVSNIYASPTSMIPPGNTLGFVTIQGNVASFTGTVTSGNSSITNVSGVTGGTLAVGQALTGAGMPTGATIGAISGTTITIYVSGSPANATATGTSVPLYATLGGANMGYTTGITASCAGASTACGIQQLNFAPCNAFGTTTASFSPSQSMMTLSSVACYSPTGVGIFWVDSGAVWTFCSWTGVNTSTNQLTGMSCGYWGSSTSWGTASAGKWFVQVNLAYAPGSTSYPTYYVLQTGGVQFGYSSSMATTWSLTPNCIGNTTCFFNQASFYQGANYYLTSGLYAQFLASNRTIHDSVVLGNVSSVGCLGETMWIGVSWHFGATNPNCTVGSNGVGPSEMYWLAGSSIINSTTSISPQMGLNTSRLRGNGIWAEFPEFVGNGSAPSISFTTGSGAMVSTSTNANGSFTVSSSGTIQFTLTWANSFAYAHRAFCHFTDETQASADAAAGALTHFVQAASATTTTLTGFGNVVSGDTISYGCSGN